MGEVESNENKSGVELRGWVFITNIVTSRKDRRPNVRLAKQKHFTALIGGWRTPEPDQSHFYFMPISEAYNMDCMYFMRDKPDKFFDLAIVDPPYGIGESSKKFDSRSKKANSGKYKPTKWDESPPEKSYFDELLRVSKNQIIWGANHFISRVPVDSSCWIVWDKENGETDYADCELAWTSFGTAVRKYVFRWQGMLQGDMKNKENRIHPTQKPVQLYRWLLKNYGGSSIDTNILDTHLGSGSSRIAADEMGFNFYGTELDKDYFEAHELRFKQYKAQLNLFAK